MAIYKVPTVIRFYKDLPHTSTGRINRRELRG
jgi:acyl-coenzyme A synthetase/AMP-(fatty) acid ligase